MNGATQLLESLPTRPKRRMPFWLIAKHGVERLEPLAIELTDGRRAPSVFSYEEARLFIRLGTRGGWQVRATGIGGLVSVLSGPCGEIGLVPLDPLPQRQAEALNGLLFVDRERFVDFLVRKGSGHQGG